MHTRTFLSLLALLTLQSGCHGSTTYRYAAMCDGNICLIGADGRSKLVVLEGGEDPSWDGFAVSPDGGCIVATLYVRDKPFAKLYVKDLANGTMRLIPTDCPLSIPPSPVWLDRETLLLQGCDSEYSLDAGVYALNVKSGKLRRAVAPNGTEFDFDTLVPSPDGKFLATTLAITWAEWISVNDAATGKTLWRTEPDRGMDGFTGLAWAPDSKSLFMSCYRHDEDFPGPGGLWKLDARTGKKRVWKYPGKDVDGVWASPDGKILAVDADELEFLRMPDGKRVATLKVPSSIGDRVGFILASANRAYLCGTRQVVQMDGSAKRVRSYDVRSILPNDPQVIAECKVVFSPTRNAVMYTLDPSSGDPSKGARGVLDLKTGQVTKFARTSWQVQWLPRDIVR